MHLVYLDESGNSGMNLVDPDQPIFCLCAMIVNEERWQSLETALEAELTSRFPGWEDIPNFEIHGTDLRSGRGYFNNIPVAERISFRDAWMNEAAKHDVRIIYRSIYKPQFLYWLTSSFGNNLILNPHVAAFALLSRSVDNYLQSLPGSPLAMLISDENKETFADIEKFISLFQGLDGELRLTRIIENGFFINSQKSLPLQLCDLFALSLRKREERKYQCGPPKYVDDSGIEIAEKLVYDDHKHDRHVIGWLTNHHQSGAKKEAARGF